ncbi:MAG: hypothetical protein M1834_009479 [Cirrosporium novae-zelandiae]|nr:MAG: hypothetical protein M1834_009479 [Cirrosporium novae-zelandiae]
MATIGNNDLGDNRDNVLNNPLPFNGKGQPSSEVIVPPNDNTDNANSVPGVGLNERLTCHECQRTFGRIEHLKRHLQGHKQERPFKCPCCQKGFYRIDALQRHELIHKEPHRKRIARGYRACLECASARTKCSGELPCTRCRARSIDCKYPNGRPAKTISTDESRLGGIPTESSEQKSNLHQNIAMDQPGLHMGQLPASDLPVSMSQDRLQNSLQYSRHSNIPPDTDTTLAHLSGNATSEVVGYSLPRESLDRLQGPTEQTVLPPTQLSHHLNATGIHPSQNHSLPIDSRNASVLAVSVGIAPEQSHGEGSRSDISNISQNVLPGARLERDSPASLNTDLWNQSILSAVNWLSWDDGPNYQDHIGLALGPVDQSTPSGISNQISNPRMPNVLSNPPKPVTHYQAINSQTPRRGWLHTIIEPQSQQAPPETEPETSSSSSQTNSGTGRYYVDGDGARLPRIKRRRLAPVRAEPGNPVSTSSLGTDDGWYMLGIPELDNILTNHCSESIPRTVKLLDQRAYREILECFQHTCISPSYFFDAFESSNFPSCDVLNQLIQFYIEFFQPLLPFIHPSTLDLTKSHWLLALAMATIGSHYVDIEESERCVASMHEFLRRAIHVTTTISDNSKPDDILVAQVKILNCVGMIYCSDERLVKIAANNHCELVTFCENEWKKPSASFDQLPNNSIESANHDWGVWRDTETRCRTGYCIWLLDCMWAFQAQLRPLLSLEDAKIPLPCQEVLWEAGSAMAWRQIFSYSDPSPTLYEATESIYVEKKLQSTMGEFSRILLIHALFRRMWEVETYLRQPLSRWSPTAEKQVKSPVSQSDSIWLPAIPLFAKWRNSTCDCLDILHWSANSVIGATSGMEHPTVLHLHLARVILLTPFRQILNLALFTVGETSRSNELDVLQDRLHVQRWATQDQYKARLAMIHAGVIFWHLRHYSANGFYEAPSIVLASLALWAYGTFAQTTTSARINDNPTNPNDTSPQPPPQSPSPPSSPDSDPPSDLPTLVQLDRPTDDELVQLFVQRGDKMRAIITGVGNLCSAKGPERVLLEGVKLLNSLVRYWGCSRRGLVVLTRLADVCREERLRGKEGGVKGRGK